MSVGLPGTGLGGIFYVMSALWMPVDAVYGRLLGKRHVPWRVILRQTGIALGVIAALWLTGWALGYLIALGPISAIVGLRAGLATPAEVSSVVRWVGVLGTVGVLAFVLAIVQVLRFAVPRPSRPRPSRP